MKFNQQVTALASLFLVSVVWSAPAMISEPTLDSLTFLEVCQPCGDVTLQYERSEMLRRIKMAFYREGREVVNALVTAMNHAKVRDLTHPAFNLDECCGFPSFGHNATSLTEMTRSEIVFDIMLLLQDVITLGQASTIRDVNVRNLKDTLCLLENYDVTETVEECVKPSPMAMCSTGQATCDAKVNLSFLKSAYQRFYHLIHNM